MSQNFYKMSADNYQAWISNYQNELNLIVQTTESSFLPMDLQRLNRKMQKEEWSILECVEHLNLYNQYYLPEIEKSIKKSPLSEKKVPLKLSWMGKKSIESVKPENQKKQTTFKRMNPTTSTNHKSQLDKKVLTQFLQDQKKIAQLLIEIQNINPNRKKVKIEFFKLFKLGIGEALIFVIEHEKRHIQQARRIIGN